RAFTGYRVAPRTQQFVFEKRRFDDSEKTFMGQTGKFTGDEIIDIILEQPEASEFITRKLWTFFAADNPSPATVTALASHFRNSNYDIASTLREMFLSEEFYAPNVTRSQVKSPVQWLVQTARILEAPLPDQPSLEAALPQLGQLLFDPPNVKGWEGGRTWISSSTLLLRYNLAGYIVSGKAPALDGFRRGAGPIQVPLDAIVPVEIRSDPEKLCDHVADRLFNAPVPERERAQFLAFLKERGPVIDEPSLRDFLHLMMSTPEYQLT
ncbi:MAG TPA: DUF1800 family protein, partial [Terrimicrobiaceae bacterium]|nr:DUF1800 family protein [Terrimicrobiaceae bacterium]